MIIAELPPIDLTATEPQTVDFSTVLQGTELLASVVWTVAGCTLGSGAYAPALSPDLRKATVWIVAGAAGRHVLNAHYVTTSSPPREDDVQLGIVIADL